MLGFIESRRIFSKLKIWLTILTFEVIDNRIAKQILQRLSQTIITCCFIWSLYYYSTESHYAHIWSGSYHYLSTGHSIWKCAAHVSMLSAILICEEILAVFSEQLDYLYTDFPGLNPKIKLRKCKTVLPKHYKFPSQPLKDYLVSG